MSFMKENDKLTDAIVVDVLYLMDILCYMNFIINLLNKNMKALYKIFEYNKMKIGK